MENIRQPQLFENTGYKVELHIDGKDSGLRLVGEGMKMECCYTWPTKHDPHPHPVTIKLLRKIGERTIAAAKKVYKDSGGVVSA